MKKPIARARAAVPSRRPVGRPPLALDKIVRAAAEIVAEGGAEALSMRSLAERLGSGTATIYRHFTNRSELIATVIDHTLGEIELDRPGLLKLSWQEASRQMVLASYETLTRHDGFASLLVGYVPVGANAMALRELSLSVYLKNGFPPPLAARAYTTMASYVLGAALQRRGGDQGFNEREVIGVFRGLSPVHFPATVAVSKSMPVSPKDEFTFGLELMLSGLEKLKRVAARTP